MGKDMLCGGQGGGLRRAGVQSQCRKPRQHLGLQKMLALPQDRLPQPGQQPFLRPLHQKAHRASTSASVTGTSLRGLGFAFWGSWAVVPGRPGKADFCQRALPAQGAPLGRQMSAPSSISAWL